MAGGNLYRLLELNEIAEGACSAGLLGLCGFKEPTYRWSAPLREPLPGKPIGTLTLDLLVNGNIRNILFYIRLGYFREYDYGTNRYFPDHEEGVLG